MYTGERGVLWFHLGLYETNLNPLTKGHLSQLQSEIWG